MIKTLHRLKFYLYPPECITVGYCQFYQIANIIAPGSMDCTDGDSTEAIKADLAVLRRITHIVDADGFIIKNVFWPREMTVLRLADDLMIRYEFKLPCKRAALSNKDARTVNFVSNNINGMLFSDEYWRKDQDRIKAMLPPSRHSPISCLIEVAKLSGSDRCLFAYKGGNYERQWLEQANIPSINLEVFGCPRFDVLLSIADKESDYCQASKNSSAVPHYLLKPATAVQSMIPCDMHIRWYARNPPHRLIHCPASECRVFSVWVNRRIAALVKCLLP